MPAIPGSVRVTGFIAPTDTLDTYAAQDETYNRGGYRTVPDANARTLPADPLYITPDRRKEGMLVKQLDTGVFWTLQGGIADINWVVQFFTAGSAYDTWRFVGNGHFPVDTKVDGAWTAPRNGTIVAVWVDVEERGTDPAPGVPMDNIWDVQVNGVTIYTAPIFSPNKPKISTTPAGGEGWSLVACGPIDPAMTAIVAGDRITVNTDQVANGATRPASFAITMLVVF